MLNCDELLDADANLRIANILNGAYRDELVGRNLLTDAVRGSTDPGIHGGPSEDDALKHFTYRFCNSAIRPVCLLVDASDSFPTIGSELLQSFSSHRVGILDIPCGSGATLLSFLTALCVARAKRLLPALPLEIIVTAADISPTAVEIYSALADRLKPSLRENGIFLSMKSQVWDAARADQTSLLCDAWFSNCGEVSEHIVLVSNISGIGKHGFDAIQRSFQHVGERIANHFSTFLWIEPGIQSSLTFMQKISRFFRENLSWLITPATDPQPPSAEFRWLNPIEQKILPGTICVQAYTRSNPATS